METQVGDKVRVKAAPYSGQRGVVASVRNGSVGIQLSQGVVQVRADEITNLSLAARKAWQSMPDRRVGRPIGTRLCDRVSVTLRIDRDVWEEFRELEASGVIDDRTATINAWLREKLADLKTKRKR